MINLKKLAREIRKQTLKIEKKKQYDYSFLGFVENQDLTDEVESCFREITLRGNWYNWVSGNRLLQRVLKKITIKTTIKEIEKILKLF